MRLFSLFIPVALVGALAAVAACGDSAGPGPQAASVTGVAGDSQTAPTGATLDFPLSLVTLNSTGQPAQGVHVTWSVTPAGGATFNPATSLSDAGGQASTIVTAGTTAQQITIQASVPGVPAPAVFHALVVDPCTYARGLVVGETANSVLTTSDCLDRSWYFDYYAFALPSGQQSLRIKQRGTFDTFLHLFNTNGEYVGFDDDSILAVQQNSQLDIIFPGDTYIIGATSYGRFVTGSYSITTEQRPAAMNGCREVWVLRGVSVTDSIQATDCADSSAVTPATYYDVARIALYDTTVLTMTVRSAAINPTLTLYQLDPNTYDRTLVVFNDDSAAGNNTAFISVQVNAPATFANFFDILIGTSTPGETGTYTFAVSASRTLSKRRSPPMPGVRAWWPSAGSVLKRSKP